MSFLTRARDVALSLLGIRDAQTAGRRDGIVFDPEGYGGYVEPANGSNTLVNLISGLGLLGTDQSVANRFVRPRRLAWSELEALHIDALGKRIAELPGHEATREGYQVRPIGAPDAALAQLVVDRLTSRAGDLGLLSRLFEARWRRRVFGSCLLIAGTEDCFERDDRTGAVKAVDFTVPLRPGSEVLWLRVVDARYYRIRETYGEGHPLCGQPRIYEVRGWDRPGLDADWVNGGRIPTSASTRCVHASRVWRDAEPEGWSIFDGLARELARLLSGAKGAEDALTGMAVPVYAIANLRQKLQRNEKEVRDQIRAANQAKSLLNALIVEKDQESFEWQKLQLGGVSDIINSLGYILSAATGIPMTLLFGMSPGGFSGGESEERNWHNYVRSVQRELGHGVTFVLDLLLGEAGINPDDFPFAVEWNKLVVLTDLEAIELRTKASEYWKRTIDAGIVKPTEVRTSAFGGEGFSYDIAIDSEGDDARANLDGREATAVLAMLSAYFTPGSTIPAEAARAFVIAVSPSLIDVATTMIPYRVPAIVPPDIAPPLGGAGGIGGGGAGAGAGANALTAKPELGAGASVPSIDDPLAVQERAPDIAGNTWMTAPQLAASHGTTESFVRRMAREGQVASRKGTGRYAARQYAQEHVIEALTGAESPRAVPEQSSEAEVPAE